MPKEIFDSVASPVKQGKKRSVVAHILAISLNLLVVVSVVVGTLLATGELPTINKGNIFVMRAEVKLPPSPSQPVTKKVTVSTNNVNPKGAPTEAPKEIRPEGPELPPWSPPNSPLCVIGCLPIGPGPVGPPMPGPPLPTPPDPPAPKKPVRISSSQAPKQTVRVNPIYPPIAQNARVEGIVVLEATIDTRGNVVNVTVLRGQALLNEAALTAVRQWKYEPHKLNGEPISVIMTVTVNFTLK